MARLSFKLIMLVALIIGIFTAADYVGHKILENSAGLVEVPSKYYVNKLLYGIPILLITILLLDKLNFQSFRRDWPRAFVLATITVLALQIRYAQLYSSKFNYWIIALHYIILTPTIFFVSRRYPEMNNL